MRYLVLALFGCGAAGCESPTEPAPTVVPAGESDPFWANLQKPCTATSPVFQVPASKRDSLPPFVHGNARTIDDDWADLAREVPGGFGGIFLDNDGATPILFLRDPGKLAAVVAGLRARGFVEHIDMNRAQARQGRWDAAQLGDWYRYVTPRVFPINGVFGAGIKESKNRLEYSVVNPAARVAVENLLSSLDLPCYLVAIES